VTPGDEGQTERLDLRLRSEEKLSGSEIQRIFREGRSWPGSLLVLFVMERDDVPVKVAFVASRRVGGAIRRNRAKRLMREVFRHNKLRLGTGGRQVVFVARRACAEAGVREVEEDFQRILSRAGITGGEGTHSAPGKQDTND